VLFTPQSNISWGQPKGLCQCGCGLLTKIAPRNDLRQGWVKGQPHRFISGHNSWRARLVSQAIVVDGQSCRTIPLTQGMSAIVSEVDFERLSIFRWSLKDARKPYVIRRGVDGQYVYLHNEVLQVPSTTLIDHRNSNGLDNRQSNLRIASRMQNGWNRKRQRNNVSGYIGVCWRSSRNCWIAQIDANYRRIRVGSFKNAKEAASAYDRAAILYHGEFARLNFPIEVTCQSPQ
jgi:hypothetical protein